jgi:AcrR family transcriptional regulator
MPPDPQDRLVSPRRKERRHAILESARSLCRLIGYEAMTMDMVAARASVTKPTLYAYFDSKEDLAVEAFVEALEERLNLLAQLPTHLPTDVRFERILEYILEEKIGAEPTSFAFPGPPISTHPRFLEASQELVDAFVALLKEGQASGRANPKLDPDVVVHTYFTILTDPRLEGLVRSGKIEREATRETLFLLLTEAIRASPESAPSGETEVTSSSAR